MMFVIGCCSMKNGEMCGGTFDGKTLTGETCADCMAGRVSCHLCGYKPKGASLALVCTALRIPEPPENVKVRRAEKKAAAERRRLERAARR